MNIRMAVALLVTLSTAGAHAQSSVTLEQIQQELTRLAREVELLKAENTELKRRTVGHESVASHAPPSTQNTSSAADRLGALEAAASRLVWKGDLRYRHEMIDPEEAADEQTRHRIRARLSATAKVNDAISAVLQVGTSGGNNDPRSTNQTLTNGFDRKGFAIDLAYMDWKAFEGATVQLGKMPMPWLRTPGYIWDTDLTPEGGAVKFDSGPFFASAFGYWLSEFSTANDSTLLGAQVGMKNRVNGVDLTVAAGYFDVGAVRGEVTSTAAGCTRPSNPAFFGGSQGNTTLTVAGCPVLAEDFDMVEALAQLDFEAGVVPVSVFAQGTRNLAADDLDIGYAMGFSVGRAVDPGTWDIGYVYQKIEKDAMFAQFVDRDVSDGITDRSGHILRGSYVPAKNWVLSGAYFLNERFVDVGPTREYRRLQIDTAYKF